VVILIEGGTRKALKDELWWSWLEFAFEALLHFLGTRCECSHA